MHLRVFIDDDGRTQFGPLELDELPPEGLRTRAMFASRPPGAVQDWHNPDAPLYIVTLSGEMEVEIEGGRKQRLGPGDVRLAADVTGPGHVSRVVGDEPWQFVVLIPEE